MVAKGESECVVVAALGTPLDALLPAIDSTHRRSVSPPPIAHIKSNRNTTTTERETTPLLAHNSSIPDSQGPGCSRPDMTLHPSQSPRGGLEEGGQAGMDACIGGCDSVCRSQWLLG